MRPNLNLFAWQDVRGYGRFRGTCPHLARSLYDWGQRHVFPEHYASWARSSLHRALRMHARRRFDVVLATGNPFASFAAAWAFNRLTRSPYILDNRDAWTLDLFSEEPRFDAGHPAWTWERRVLATGRFSCSPTGTSGRCCWPGSRSGACCVDLIWPRSAGSS